MATLQDQGVPFPDKLETQKFKESGTYKPRSRPRKSSGRRSRGSFRQAGSKAWSMNPAKQGESAMDDVSTLEAEFLLALLLLIMLLFTGSASFSDKIMSFIKRGTLLCLLFFILALVSSIGPNTARVAKIFGALIILGMLLTSDVTPAISDLDNMIKNDWSGTTENAGSAPGNTTGASSDTGTQEQTANPVELL